MLCFFHVVQKFLVAVIDAVAICEDNGSVTGIVCLCMCASVKMDEKTTQTVCVLEQFLFRKYISIPIVTRK